jgi:pSer/pThr/pTyr-binding forkhead associated (FHA) protein
VNSERIERHVLEHGDLIRIGTARFRFVDQSADD